jgi:hypothetical protein
MDQIGSNYGHIILIYPLPPRLNESHNNHFSTVNIICFGKNIRFKAEDVKDSVNRCSGQHEYTNDVLFVQMSRILKGHTFFSQHKGGALDNTNYIVASTSDEFSSTKASQF